jgi:hypothetical protein
LRSLDTHWLFCPNVFANYTFAVFFGSTSLLHIVQAIYYKRKDCWIIVVGASCQLVAYVIRGLSIHLPLNQWLFLAWNALLMVCSWLQANCSNLPGMITDIKP